MVPSPRSATLKTVGCGKVPPVMTATITDSASVAITARRRVIVTGGARGIGAEIARRFGALGDLVVVLDLLDDVARVVVSEFGGRSITCDLADADATRTSMDSAIEWLGGLDILVNNAGVFRITPLLDISTEEWDWVLAINARAILVTTQRAAKLMIQQGTGGRIINMASMGGKVGAAGQAHYAASKAAVISLTQVSAAEFGPHGITVNSICPGYVLTEMGAATRTDEQVAEWSAKSPLGRLGDPIDIAKVATFLASDDADYLTGQAINVCGGMITH
jgi:NAD(P)-dependent dehydrogenase (short-subunit alcohol dehydrogenase family)